ncbi:MAG: hypothetical protein HFI44_16120 [Lachnospiraceae bacterium]|nr:hypothetical protein [Lachnospiraceae bacterium]
MITRNEAEVSTVTANKRNGMSTTWEYAYSLDNISFMDTGEKTEGSLCLITHEGDNARFYKTFFGEYIAFNDVRVKRYLPDGKEEYIQEYEKYIINFYNYRTEEIDRTLDMIAMAAEYKPGLQYFSGIDAIRIRGRNN